MQKRLNRSICCLVLDSGGPKEAQVPSYLPGGANVPTREDTLAPPVEYDLPGKYDLTVHLWRDAVFRQITLTACSFKHCSFWILPSVLRFLLHPREQWSSIVMSASVCVCVSVSGFTRTIFTNLSEHVAYGRGSVLLWQCDEIPRGRGSFGGILPQLQCIVQHSIWVPYKNGWTDRHVILDKTLVAQGTMYLMECRSPNRKGQFPRVVWAIKKHGQPSVQPFLQCHYRQQRHAAEGIIHYARQVQIGIRKILGAGNAAYQPGMGWWECTVRAKSDIYSVVTAFAAKGIILSFNLLYVCVHNCFLSAG